MKNPNEYGMIVKPSDNRLKPYCVRKISGWTDKGHTYSSIRYFERSQDALIALAEYNKSPYDIDIAKITLAKLCQRWSERSFPKMHKKQSPVIRLHSNTQKVFATQFIEILNPIHNVGCD